MMSHHNHEVFIFLNNIGITLLQRHRYRESVATLQEALRFARDDTTISPSQQPNTSQQGEEGETTSRSMQLLPSDNERLAIREAVLKASERLLLSHQPQQCNAETLECGNAVMDPVIVLELSNDDCFSTILHYGPSIDQIDFVVRMNEHAPWSSMPCYWKIENAILLQNLAVACKRFSDTSDDECNLSDEWRHTLYEKSSSLFREANHMISKTLANLITDVMMQSGRCSNDQILFILHAVMVSMFTMAQMCDIMYRSNSDSEAIQYHANFQRSYQFLRLSVQQQKRRSGMITADHAACA